MNKAVAVFALALAFGLGFAVSRALFADPQTNQQTPGRVTGIGGIFFKCKDPKTLKDWYAQNLGLQGGPYGANFVWWEGADKTKQGSTQWTPFSEKTKYFDPSTKEFMINYRVDNLGAVLAKLKTASVLPLDKIDVEPYGRFVHVMDPEGNKIELWEPTDDK
jgi:predicted enzyme related to lactoylglutathione lyase